MLNIISFYLYFYINVLFLCGHLLLNYIDNTYTGHSHEQINRTVYTHLMAEEHLLLSMRVCHQIKIDHITPLALTFPVLASLTYEADLAG